MSPFHVLYMCAWKPNREHNSICLLENILISISWNVQENVQSWSTEDYYIVAILIVCFVCHEALTRIFASMLMLKPPLIRLHLSLLLVEVLQWNKKVAINAIKHSSYSYAMVIFLFFSFTWSCAIDSHYPFINCILTLIIYQNNIVNYVWMRLIRIECEFT